MGETRAGRGDGVRVWLKEHEKGGKQRHPGTWRPGEEHLNGYQVPSEDKKKTTTSEENFPG